MFATQSHPIILNNKQPTWFSPLQGATGSNMVMNLPVLPTLPLFNPDGNATGLALLAEAATQHQVTPLPQESVPLLLPPQSGTLSLPGPYSPSAALPTKVVKRILNLEYLEMSEIANGRYTLAGCSPTDPTSPACN